MIDYTFSSPVSRFRYYLASTFATGLVARVFEIPVYIIIFIVVLPQLTLLNLILFFVCVALVYILMLFISLILGAMLLLYKQIGGLASLISTIFSFLSGAYVPIILFPQAVGSIAILLPQTDGLYLARYYLVNSTLIVSIPTAWLILIVEIIIFGILAKFSLYAAESEAKKSGLQYI